MSRLCLRVPPPDFWGLLQEMGADFAMVSGLLGGFRGALRGIDSDDLGKRWSCVAFRAESTYKTAQKLRAGSAGFALIAFWLVRFIDSRTSASSFVIQRTWEQGMGVRSGVGREFSGVIGYDITKDELVRVANALK